MPTVASDIVGRRVRIWYGDVSRPCDVEGPIHAVGIGGGADGFVLLVEQTLSGKSYYPLGELGNHFIRGANRVELLNP
jgi:hypothetical protein